MKRKKFWIILVSIGVGVALLVGWKDSTLNKESTNVLVDNEVLQSLPQKNASGISRARLTNNLAAPTNTWFSGIALGDQPQAAYPLPYSVKADNSSLSASYPKLTSTPNTIFGLHGDDIKMKFGNAVAYEVTDYDKMRLTLTYINDKKEPQYNVTITEGSPYIYVRAVAGSTLSIEGGVTEETEQGRVFRANNRSYLAVSDAKQSHQVATASYSMDRDDLLTLVALPTDTTEDRVLLARYAGNELERIDISHKQSDDSITTIYTPHTKNGKPTYIGVMPHQKNMGTSSVDYSTLYGHMQLTECEKMCEASVAKVHAKNTLEIETLTDEQRQELKNHIRNDVINLTFKADDTYFSGKELYKAANLYQLALQLGETTQAESVKKALVVQLNQWLTTNDYNSRSVKKFYYDTEIKGLVGEKVAFGSEQFNDHHFHYGYLLYAGATIAANDESMKQKWQPMLNLIAADYGSPIATNQMPAYRNFDPFKGHSWASGDGQFADGNNQESSSEAINAWNGLGLWAKASGNADLLAHAEWMLSLESAAASTYWRTPDLTDFTGYQHPLVSLNWGGKRDYATFFSPDPKAIFGIQLIPVTPSMRLNDGRRATDNISTITNDVGQFSDYILMYQASNGTDTSTAARELSSMYIDGANSRSYMVAWIYTELTNEHN